MTKKRGTPHEAELTPVEADFALRAGSRLNDSTDTLDAATRSRLNRARQRALDELPDGRRTRAGWWLPAGAVAISAAVAISLWQTSGPTSDSGTTIPVAASEITDMELLLGDGDLEMIEDLEFFAWLATDESMQPETT